jgi:CheY-like chemotaxis protein
MTSSSTTPSAASTCTVLLIEDDPEDLEFWSRKLRNCPSNYSVLEASSCQKAFELLRHQKVDCVVLDLDMSASSGLSVLFELVPDRDCPQIAVVILTRLPYSNLGEIALRYGAQAYLVKQRTSADTLDKAIQNAMTSVATMNERSPKDCG